MMIQVVSDVHLEFHRDRGREFLANFPVAAETLVLAGDYCSARGLSENLAEIARKFRDVVYCWGNHECYGTSIAHVREICRGVAKHVRNVHILDGSSVEIGGARFVGGTLWFPDDPQNALYAAQLSDFGMIRDFDPYGECERDCRFLREEVRSSDVVVTHHLPHPASVAPRYEGSPYNRFFLCDVSDVIETAQPRLWVHGHTHDACDYTIGRTRVVCNPVGYPHEVTPGYKEPCVVEI